MEHKVKMVDPQELIPSLLELLNDAPSVPLLISGNSMSPFLIHGRDTVYLSRITQPPKVGDMILYRRDNGRYVLHRIYAVHETFTMVGDAQTQLETGIRPDQMLAIVTAVCRRGKHLEKGSFWWDFFEKRWIRMVVMRPAVQAIYSRAKKLLD